MSVDEGGGAPAAEPLQFETVDRTAPAARSCPACNRPIADTYFEIAGKVICPTCATSLSGGKNGRGSLPRAALWGAGAALLGTLVWFAIVKLTNHEIGLVAIGVGLIVGMAVRRGGRGLGGWRYQALAIILTYVSITASYVPFVIEGVRKAHDEKAATIDSSTGTPAEPQADQAGEPGARTTGAKPVSPKPNLGLFALAWVIVFGIAFTAPFLNGNIMGLIIIGIALYEAWKINRRVPLSGPFRLGGGMPAVAAGGAPPSAASP